MATTTTKIEQTRVKTKEQEALINDLLQNFSPEMLQEMFGQMMSSYQQAQGVASGQMAPIDEEDMRQRFQTRTADPAMKQFQEQIVPMLQERFTASGSGGGPDEQALLTSGGQQLSEDLARQFEDVYQGAQDRQLQAAQVSGGLSAQQLQAMYPFLNLSTGTDVYQPVARQTTKTSALDAFLTGAGQGVGQVGATAAAGMLL